MNNSTSQNSLTETVNVGILHAALALSKMIGRKVEMGVPTISWRYPSRLLLEVITRDEKIAASAINLLQPMPSKVLLIYPFKSAFSLYRAFGGFDENHRFEFSEEEISFIKEISNILAGSFATAVCDHLGLEKVHFGIPNYFLLTGKSLTDAKAFLRVAEGENILYAESRLTISGTEEDIHLYMMFKPDQIESILPLLDTLES